MPRSSSQLMLSMLIIHPYTDTHTHTRAHTHINIIITHPATISSRHSAPAHVSEGVCVCVCVCVCSALGDSGHPHIHKAMLRRCCVCLSTLAISAWDTADCCSMLSHHTCTHTSVRPSRMQQQPSHSAESDVRPRNTPAGSAVS